MSRDLSILIPCYNGLCLPLVDDLSRQAQALERESGGAFRYEILVGDDGSTDPQVIASNRSIEELPHCTYLLGRPNRGRAAIRNYLAREARYETLLFIDCDMRVRADGFLGRYLQVAGHCDAAYGGYVLNGDPRRLAHNLRYLYERRGDSNALAQKRLRQPYRDIHTSNLLLRRSTLLEHPLDERFRRYGYEDVLLGKTLCECGATVTHVDNPVSFEKFESNEAFVAKTIEGLQTLASFEQELAEYSRLAIALRRLEALRLLPLLRAFNRLAGGALRRNLEGGRPCVRLFSLFKLCKYCEIRGKASR
ncbi:MAG: glycosyltransferase [Prevotellaceae bacterium]|nr:glycosyltransferase [Prevotellaceae bacterium]